MKKLLIILVGMNSNICGYDPVGLFTWPLTLVGSAQKTMLVNPERKSFFCNWFGIACPLKERVEINTLYTFESGVSLNWWRVRRVTILDTGSNKDVLQHNRPRVAPGFYMGIKRLLYQSWNYPVSLEGGYYFQFCQRNDSMRTDFFDQGENWTDIELRQRVQSVRFGPRLMVNLETQKFVIGAFTQLSLVARTTTGLKLYEKSKNAFTGQRLEPYYRRVQGEFGANFKIPLKQYGSLKIEYSMLLGRVNYKRKIITEVADSWASEQFNDQLFLTDINSQMLPAIPSLKVRMNALSVGIELLF